MSTRIIRTLEGLLEYQKEVRNRQYEDNPVTVEFVNDYFITTEPYNWNKEYVKVTRINNHERIELIKTNNLILEYLRYAHIFNYNLAEEKIYI